ncbi:MAG: arginine--tRNA ligase [Microgenomates group bacterium]
MIEEKIKEKIREVLKNLGYKKNEEIIELALPKLEHFGDFSTNIAFKLAKDSKESSYLIALKIKENLPPLKYITAITVVKPGFINFCINESYYIDLLKKQIKENFLSGNKNHQKVVIEFGQPNTHKIPHIGHLYSYIYGESLARIFEFNHNKIFRVNYQGDIGLHVAKCLYKAKQKINEMKKINNLEEKIYFLQKCYQEGSKEYEVNPKAKEEIDKLNIQIYEKDPEVFNLWAETRKWSLEFYKNFEKQLGIDYDRYYFESETAPIGKKIVLDNLNKVFKKSQQAIIFEGKKYGLHDRVFINKYGNPTYEAKDIGLAYLKKRDFDFDLSIITTASEQNEYWKVVIRVIELIFPELKNKIKHLGFGMVTLTTGKISSRTGNIVDPLSLIEKVKQEIKNRFAVKDEMLLNKIAFAAIKYSFLSSDYKKNIVFDLEKSIAKEGNSGPYLLYTYVRCLSVIRKAKTRKYSGEFNLPKKNGLSIDEKNLIKKITLFPKMVLQAKENYAPNFIANYLYNLASDFNFFYQKYPILKSEEYFPLRFLITQSVAKVLKKGLFLLGIETVERM